MHELIIAENLVAIIAETAEKEKLSAVTKVSISLGQASQVVPELLETAFHIAAQGTMADNAKLETEIIPLKLRCTGCGKDYIADEYNFICEYCGSPDIEIVSGMEIFIKSIEGE